MIVNSDLLKKLRSDIQEFLNEGNDGSFCLIHRMKWLDCKNDPEIECVSLSEYEYESSSLSDSIVLLDYLLQGEK